MRLGHFLAAIALAASINGRVVISQSTQHGELDSPVNAHALLLKAKNAVSWIDNSRTITEVKLRTVSDSLPPMYSGGNAIVTKIQSLDGRLYMKEEYPQSVQHDDGILAANGAFAESFETPGQFLYSLHYGATNEKNLVNIARAPADIARRRTWTLANCSKGGFLEGGFAEDTSTGYSIFDSAEQGQLSADIGHERLRGIDCLVLNAISSEGTLRIWIAPSKGYNLVRFEVRHSSKAGPHPYQFEATMDATEYKITNGRTFVSSGRYEGAWLEPTRDILFKDTATAERTEFELSPNFANSDPFAARNVKNGSVVIFDDGSPIQFEWRDGKPVPKVDYDAANRIADAVTNGSSKGDISLPADRGSGIGSLVGIAVLSALAAVLAIVLLVKTRGKNGASVSK